MKAILTLLLVLSSCLVLLGISSYSAGNGLGFVLILGGSLMTTAILTIWILNFIKEKRDARKQKSETVDFDDLIS